MPDHETLPPDPRSTVPHVGTYRRVLPVSLERMYENALDWEHLPYVHASSFRSIRCEEAGSWGWRAAVENGRGERSTIELRLDRPLRRWITRNLEGPNVGAEIWTHAFPLGSHRVDINVDFFVPGVAPETRERVGRAYAALYARLYDEDVAMMVERQRQLDARVDAVRGEASIELGPRAELELPREVTLGSKRYMIAEVRGELVAYPSLCPHQLGPLDAAELDDGVITCPWHGYRFDVVSGDCVSGQRCRFTQVPVVELIDGRVRVTVAG